MRQREPAIHPSHWAKRFRSLIQEDKEAESAWGKIQRANLAPVSKHLLYVWSAPGIRPLFSEALQRDHELRRAARRAVRVARERRSEKSAAIFRRRELDALLAFASTATLDDQKRGSFETALKRALNRPATAPKRPTPAFQLVVLRIVAASKNVSLTWNEIAILAKYAREAGGCKAAKWPDIRELRRYSAGTGVRELARSWIAAFAPVVDVLWQD